MGTVTRIFRQVRARLYDAAIVPLTADWYRQVLERLPVGSHLLDVGIGTGGALLANAALLETRDLHVTGVDIDADYLHRCRAQVSRRELGHRIAVHEESIYDHRGGPYDAAYFSGSFMLLPEPTAALRHVCSLLRDHATVYFTQTFEHHPSPLLERLKPLLRMVTTIDFGRVTYETDFRRTLGAAGLEIDTIEIVHTGHRRSSVLVVAQARPVV